jgi:hypothetical protein
MTMLARELPLMLVECCGTKYVVSELHPVPPCPECGQIPTFVRQTSWWLEL